MVIGTAISHPFSAVSSLLLWIQASGRTVLIFGHVYSSLRAAHLAKVV